MARCLIIGCGCSGRSLAVELVGDGHAVRGTTRDRTRRGAIESAGAEAHVGDPDRVSTLVPALEHVTVACILLGSAQGSPQRLADLHGTRLEMLLSRMVDTTVRGIVYEAAGTVDTQLLHAGASLVKAACEDARIPHALLDAERADHERWCSAARDAVSRLVGGPCQKG